MVGHRSTGLPECGPTESSAPEPCFHYITGEFNYIYSNCYIDNLKQGNDHSDLFFTFDDGSMDDLSWWFSCSDLSSCSFSDLTPLSSIPFSI